MTTLQKTAILVFLFLFGAVANAQINVTTEIIRPTVEMIWEAHSYIPPFYKGKALYPIGGEVTVLALPPASLGNPNALTYTWKRDGQVQGSLSGVGKSSFSFSGSQFGDIPLVVVEVSSGNARAVGALQIQQINPVIRFYENKPLEGVALEHALPQTLTTTKKDIALEVYPYFFSANTNNDSSLAYSWSANGKKILDAKGPSIVVQSDEPRSIIMLLSMNHVAQILQRASTSILVTFE
ncbi:MAG: hypothetical protein NUW02_01095 [Candidatus Campbellbacteria bacterium]|nr:hypothetical protein [Candidatus Campbellbacteria bacterium]